jgi:hypothetical protein
MPDGLTIRGEWTVTHARTGIAVVQGIRGDERRARAVALKLEAEAGWLWKRIHSIRSRYYIGLVGKRTRATRSAARGIRSVGV